MKQRRPLHFSLELIDENNMLDAVLSVTVEQFLYVEIRHCRFAFSSEFLSYFVFRHVVSGEPIRKLIML